MSDTLHLNPSRALDLNGYAVPHALAYFYNSGTMTMRRVYADPDGNVPLPQPVQADGAGLFPVIHDLAAGDAKVIVRTQDGAMLPGYPLDPVPRSVVGDTGARGVVFAPTDDIPVTNVQDAIEQVQENIVAPLAEFGLGVTGNADLITNLDSTIIGSGFYRYDGTTNGDFPSGVEASDGGVALIWRQTNARLVQMLIPTDGARVWQRVHDGSWGAWRWHMTSADMEDDSVWKAGGSTSPRVPSPANVRAAATAVSKEVTLGYDQTWQDMYSERTGNTVYTNDTGKAITVNTSGGGTDRLQVRESADDQWKTLGVWANNYYQMQSMIVPAGWQYRKTGGRAGTWMELR